MKAFGLYQLVLLYLRWKKEQVADEEETVAEA
jgi:hypothetical protein